jgi:hypothetical protein
MSLQNSIAVRGADVAWVYALETTNGNTYSLANYGTEVTKLVGSESVLDVTPSTTARFLFNLIQDSTVELTLSDNDSEDDSNVVEVNLASGTVIEFEQVSTRIRGSNGEPIGVSASGESNTPGTITLNIAGADIDTQDYAKYATKLAKHWSGALKVEFI